jgi:Tfp pilus assembly protein PilO
MINLTARFGLDNLDTKKIILIVIICLIIVYLDFNFFMALQLKMLKNLGPQIIKIKADLAKLDKDLVDMQELKNKQATSAKTPSTKAKKIILEEDIPSLLKGISDIANINDVKITQMKPSKEPQAKETKAPGDNIEGLARLWITLDLTGGYHHLGRFINDLENTEVFMAVENLKITPQNPADYLKQKASLVLKTYVKK